ncbi:SMC-Scp complex subunit ScpB [bacterium]|nr:SMC-Scp complex subunit ScpB [bacterium]
MSVDLKRTVEALLFAAPEPLSLSRLQAILPDVERRALPALLAELAADYDAGGHAFQLAELGGGWRIVTRPAHAARIEELLRGQRRVRLTRASLETLAVVAYRQPCTRVDVEAVRGVNCGGSLATLIERGLLRITGRAETLGRPLLYGTTPEFLGFLGVNGLDELPRLAEIEALLAPADAEGESPVPAGERRERLLDGVDALETLLAERALADGEPELAAAAAAWRASLAGGGDAGADAEALGAEEPLAHRAALDAALAAERALLAEAADALSALDAEPPLAADDAAEDREPALARIARALVPPAPAGANAPAAADAAWAAEAGGED